MTTSPASEVPMSDKDYCQIATDTFQGYADDNLEGKPLWESIEMDFEDWTKEHWDAINGKTWTAIKAFCLPLGVWIDDYKGHGSRSEILMKLVSAAKFDTKLKDWDMDRIEDVQNTYGKVSRGIALRLQHLRGKEPEEIQQFQDTGYQPTQEPQYTHKNQRHSDHELAPIWISDSVPPPGKMIALDFGRYNICNRRNDHQPTPTPVSNPVPNSFNSEIQKDCECIPECLTALASPAQVPSGQAPPSQAAPTNAPLIQAPLAQVPPVQVSLVPASPRQAPSVQAPAAQELPVQAPPVLAAQCKHFQNKYPWYMHP